MITTHIEMNNIAHHTALSEAELYFRFHRIIAQQAGEALGVDMRDHDLSKTRLVQLALAYCWHWPEWAPEKDKN